MRPPVPANAPEFVRNVEALMIISGDGDQIPVSAMPIDGTFPTATTKWEKRNIALEIPVWDEEPLHPVRQVRHGLPARRHPRQGLRHGGDQSRRPKASRRPCRSGGNSRS